MLSRTHHGIQVHVNLRRAAFAWLIAGVIWFALEAIAASAFPGYSYARNYISDLGDPLREVFDGRPIDSRLAWVMNADFVAHGIGFLIGALFAFRAAARGRARFAFVALVVCNAIGGSVVAIVHSSNASTANGTVGWHDLGALVSILSGDLAIAFAGLNARRFGASNAYRFGSLCTGLAGSLSLAVLIFAGPMTHVGNGIWERGSVYAIMLWEIATALVLLRRRI